MGRMKRSGYEERNADLALAADQKHCWWCKKTLSHRPVLHRNKFQQPEILKFCSKDCHNSWCYSEKKVSIEDIDGETETEQEALETPETPKASKQKKKTTGKGKK